MSKYFKRVIRVMVGGVTITNETLHIEFEIPFDDDHTANTATLRIYNLSKSTIAAITRKANIIVEAGYEGDVGVVLEGEVTDVYSNQAGADRATHITVTDRQGTNNEKKVEKAFGKGTKSSTIIKSVASQIGLKLKVVSLSNDKTHAKGYNANGKGVDVIKSLAEDGGASFYPILGEWYVRNILDGDNINFTLSPQTGLLGIPERMNKRYQNKEMLGWRVEALLQHKVRTAAILTLDSKTAKGKYRVIGGKHIATASDFKTILEVMH